MKKKKSGTNEKTLINRKSISPLNPAGMNQVKAGKKQKTATLKKQLRALFISNDPEEGGK
jgi:hypothetical protein